MSKLFEVEFTVRAVVQADDSTHAYSVAMAERRDIFSDTSIDDVDVCREITEASHLPDGWDTVCIPYGGDGNTRIGAILANLRKRHPPSTDDAVSRQAMLDCIERAKRGLEVSA